MSQNPENFQAKEMNHIYHERQVRGLCAIHALNNLFQDPTGFTQKSFDEICSKLDPNSWINNHKSIFGIGDYDINVLNDAIEKRGYRTLWFDSRQDPMILELSNIFGFLMNVPAKKRTSIFHWLPLTSKRHWYAIRDLPTQTEKQEGVSQFYNLDSLMETPRLIGSRILLLNFLRNQLENPEKHLLIIVTPEVERDESWRRD